MCCTESGEASEECELELVESEPVEFNRRRIHNLLDLNFICT